MAEGGFNLSEAILGNAVGYGVGTAMGTALQAVVQGLANDIWNLSPTMPLPADVAATVALKHPARHEDMRKAARLSGFDSGPFADMLLAEAAAPGVGELLELLRRRELSPADVRDGLRDALIPDRWHDPLMALRKVLLSPADLAMMRQQSFIDRGEQYARSALQGVDQTDAELLFEISGEPPGPETMIALWRRGEISEDRVRQAVVEGRLKLKYVDDIVKLKHVPLSASIAAEAVLRERHLPRDPHYYAAAAGLDPADFDAWVDMMGRPIPTGEALTLARRKQFTQAQFREAVARSDVRTEYADDLWKLRRVLPTPMELRRMIAQGAVTDTYAITTMIERGYDREVAEGVVKAAHGDQGQGSKDLAASQVIQLYEAGFESRDWAIEQLKGLGYDDANADLALTVSEARRIINYLNAVVARIKAAYVSHRISLDTALADLEQAGITAELRQQYTDIWDAERDANVRRITPAQVAKLYKLELIGRDEAIGRWMQQGYPREDAELYAKLTVHADATTPSPIS